MTTDEKGEVNPPDPELAKISSSTYFLFATCKSFVIETELLYKIG